MAPGIIRYKHVRGIVSALGEVVVSVDLEFANRHGGPKVVALMMFSDASVNAQKPGRNKAGHSTMTIDGETVTVTRASRMFEGRELPLYLVSSNPDAQAAVVGEIDVRRDARN